MPLPIDRLERLPQPRPDVEQFKAMLRRGRPAHVPLVELAIAEEVLAALAGPLPPLPATRYSAPLKEWAEARVGAWWRLGYDYYRLRAEIPFAVQRFPARDPAPVSLEGIREWMNEHAGLITSMEDVERYPWPTQADVDFGPAEALVTCLPEGMGAIGFSGGVLEWASALMGLETLMIALRRAPELVRCVVDRVGEVILKAFEVFCQMEAVFALWLGDDMGFKTSTLISPQHLREFILPWHRRCAELAHRSGRLFLLHSCGQVEAVMPDLVHQVGIDAKHSFEDIITPVEQFQDSWGGHVAVLGGIDVDLLSRASPEEIERRTRGVLARCAPRGGYACGSGNSITNYIPAENYLAMVEAVHRFNGRM